MTSVTCETTTLADAVMRAARVAPNKGAAFDKASGILLEVTPAMTPALRVKATDLEVTYFQRVPTTKAEGDPTKWRVSSKLFADIAAALPLGSGSQVTLANDGDQVVVTSGDVKAQLRTMDAERFPAIRPFDPTGMEEVDDLPRRLDQVTWATDPKGGVLSGVYVDGDYLTACDRIRAAFVPCKVPVVEPVVVPMRTVNGLLRSLSSVKVRATSQALELMPDADTQIRCTLMLEVFPDVRSITRDDFAVEIGVDREALVNSVNRLRLVARGERYSMVRVVADEAAAKLDLSLEVKGVGRMDDSVTATVKGGDFKFNVGPNNLLDALESSKRTDITLSVGPNADHAFRVTDGDDYEAWIMPLKDMHEKPTSEEEA